MPTDVKWLVSSLAILLLVALPACAQQPPTSVSLRPFPAHARDAIALGDGSLHVVGWDGRDAFWRLGPEPSALVIDFPLDPPGMHHPDRVAVSVQDDLEWLATEDLLACRPLHGDVGWARVPLPRMQSGTHVALIALPMRRAGLVVSTTTSSPATSWVVFATCGEEAPVQVVELPNTTLFGAAPAADGLWTSLEYSRGTTTALARANGYARISVDGSVSAWVDDPQAIDSPQVQARAASVTGTWRELGSDSLGGAFAIGGRREGNHLCHVLASDPANPRCIVVHGNLLQLATTPAAVQVLSDDRLRRFDHDLRQQADEPLPSRGVVSLFADDHATWLRTFDDFWYVRKGAGWTQIGPDPSTLPAPRTPTSPRPSPGWLLVLLVGLGAAIALPRWRLLLYALVALAMPPLVIVCCIDRLWAANDWWPVLGLVGAAELGLAVVVRATRRDAVTHGYGLTLALTLLLGVFAAIGSVLMFLLAIAIGFA